MAPPLPSPHASCFCPPTATRRSTSTPCASTVVTRSSPIPRSVWAKSARGWREPLPTGRTPQARAPPAAATSNRSRANARKASEKSGAPEKSAASPRNRAKPRRPTSATSEPAASREVRSEQAQQKRKPIHHHDRPHHGLPLPLGRIRIRGTLLRGQTRKRPARQRGAADHGQSDRRPVPAQFWRRRSGSL